MNIALGIFLSIAIIAMIIILTMSQDENRIMMFYLLIILSIISIILGITLCNLCNTKDVNTRIIKVSSPSNTTITIKYK